MYVSHNTDLVNARRNIGVKEKSLITQFYNLIFYYIIKRYETILRFAKLLN